MYIESCSVPALVANALNVVKVPNRINVKVDVDDVLVRIDISRMVNVLSGVIQNAVQAIPQEGTIQITTNVEQGKLALSVTDSGEGIPEAVRPKIFTPLVTTKAKGMGMSLAIFKRIVEAHDGKITIRSQTGSGTKVNILLPLPAKNS